MRTTTTTIAPAINAIRPVLLIDGKAPATEWLAFYLDCHWMTRGRVLHVNVQRLSSGRIHRDIHPARAAERNQLSSRSVSNTIKEDSRIRCRVVFDGDNDEFHQEF